MHEIYTYKIEVQGQVDTYTLNSSSPNHMAVVWEGTVSTQLSTYTDQSGMIGSLRHLHHQGYIILSAKRENYALYIEGE